MATTQAQPETTLQIRRTFAAPRERVYRAWTDAKQFALWFHPTVEYTTIITQMDLRNGGAYKLEMHHKGGNVSKLEGRYKEVNPPEKLVFTWRWQHIEGSPETLVSVEFHDLGESTEILLKHSNFTTIEQRDKHNEGWTGCFVLLEKQLAS
ncbi:MAG TPA: SRPBCC domain-containing protein [Dongiaceae bacterium]|nr:SRPBCC domain-containing protein [Dongiaceae bacterium]